MFITLYINNPKTIITTYFHRFGILLFILIGQVSIAQPKVQWASKVLAFSSERVDAYYPDLKYRAIQILGKPNTVVFNENAAAWSPAQADNFKNEFIKVGFSNPIFVSQIIVAENFNAGAITQIFAYDSTDKEYLIHENNLHVLEEKGRFWAIKIPKTDYKVSALKIVLNPYLVKGFNQIDAIGITEENTKVEINVNLPKNTSSTTIKENLGKSINSNKREVAPVISSDGKRLFFTREGDDNNIGKYKNQDVWVSNLNPKNNWSKAQNIGEPINTSEHNAVSAASIDGKTLYLVNIYLPNNQYRPGFSKSSFRNGAWTFPTALKIKDYYNLNSYSELSITPDENVIILAIQKKDSFGSKDLYVSFLQSDSTWSNPINMGGVLNTAGTESTPFIAADSKTLYFSTNGFPGYGDSDIFMSRRLDDTWTNWSEPINLGNSINTTKWDGYFVVSASGEFAYTSSEDNSIGAEDIFKVKLFDEIKPEPVAYIKGQILNEKINAATVSIFEGENLLKKRILEENEFNFFVALNKKYTLKIDHPFYKTTEQTIDLSSQNRYVEIQKDILLEK